MNQTRLHRWLGPAIILIATFIAVGPLLWLGPPQGGGDFGFHFISWIDARQSILMSNLYPHWAYSPNFGAGEPRFIFYPPITWMAGAILGMLLPWNSVPLTLFILLLAATGFANRALAKESMAEGPATLAGCASIFLGYALFSVYKRGDFSELTGEFWIPLLLLFALRRRNPSGSFLERTFDGSATPLALIIAGIWLTSGPVGIMASYLLVAVALLSALIEKSLVPVARASAATFAGMALASLYLVPAIRERKWASIPLALTGNFMVEKSWLFAHHADPDMLSHDIMLHHVSNVAVFMLAVAFAGGAIAWLRRVVPGERRWWLPLALIPPTVLFLLFPVSHFVWNTMPALRMLQFPWRWLVVLEAPMAIAFASAVWLDRKALRISVIVACAALFAGISLIACHWWFLEAKSFEAELQESVREGAGVLGRPEYAPPGIRFPQLNRFVANACLLDTQPAEPGLAPAWDGNEASCKSASWHQPVLMGAASQSSAAPYMVEERHIVGVADHPGYLILRLRYYPAWTVTVNGTPVTPMADRNLGLMAVPVPQGNDLVSVDWTTTSDVIAGRCISAAALLFVAGLYAFERRRLHPHLNLDNSDSPIPTQQSKSRNNPSRKQSKNARRK